MREIKVIDKPASSRVIIGLKKIKPRRLLKQQPNLFIRISLVFVALLICASALARVTVTQKTKSAAARSKTEDIYLINCARCHGADGRGDTALGRENLTPDFTDVTWWKKNSENTSSSRLRATVMNGKGKMPAFDKKLSRSEIDGLVKHVRRFKGKKLRITDVQSSIFQAF